MNDGLIKSYFKKWGHWISAETPLPPFGFNQLKYFFAFPYLSDCEGKPPSHVSY